jgi:hypothetical protein
MSLDSISNALARSHKGRAKGVTVAYTGTFSNTDHWAVRTTLKPEDLPHSKAIHATDELSLPPRPLADVTNTRKRRSVAQVDEDCKDQTLEPTLKMARHYHSRKPAQNAKKSAPPAREPAQSKNAFLEDPPVEPTLETMTLAEIWAANQNIETGEDLDDTPALDELVHDPSLAATGDAETLGSY